MSTDLLIIFGCPVGVIFGTGLGELTETRERYRETKWCRVCLYVLFKKQQNSIFRGFLCVKWKNDSITLTVVVLIKLFSLQS